MPTMTDNSAFNSHFILREIEVLEVGKERFNLLMLCLFHHQRATQVLLPLTFLQQQVITTTTFHGNLAASRGANSLFSAAV